MGYLPSLGSRAVHFVSGITTVILNPISDDSPKPPEEDLETKSLEEEEEGDSGVVDSPDTSSFTAFLVALLSPSNSSHQPTANLNEDHADAEDRASTAATNERTTLFTRGKRTLGKVIHKAAKVSGLRQNSEPKVDCNIVNDVESTLQSTWSDVRQVTVTKDSLTSFDLPDMSEPSLLLSDNTRAALYFSLPALVKGSNWLLLYSTWRHGISLSTLYRRSALCPGYSLLVVGDKKGAVFGGLVESPLQPTNQRKYQGTNSSFVFTDLSGNPVIFQTTGINHYFTLCSSDFLALGGGGHFALYLDGDLLNGSSSSSDTFGNSCLAHSEEFEVKEIELWGFVYASQYDEMVDLCRTEKPETLRW